MSDLRIGIALGVGIIVALALWLRWLNRAITEALSDDPPVRTGAYVHPRIVQPVVDHGSRCRIGLPVHPVDTGPNDEP